MKVPIPDSVPAAVAYDLGTAGTAAVRGGLAAMRYYGDDRLGVADKGVNDPVTEADYAANDAIHAVLANRSADDPILSEESPPLADETLERTPRLWVVDPLDGTKEFLARNSEFAVMVGLATKGRACIGALFQPVPGTLFLGWADGGAWAVPVEAGPGEPRYGEPTRLELESGPADPIRFIRSRSHRNPLLTSLEERITGATTVLCGSVGVKCARIATNEADFYVHPVAFLKEWDTCAPEAVLRGAGGRVTDCGGDPLSYGKPDPRQRRGIFAARVHTWDALHPMVRDVAAPILSVDG